MRSAAAFETVTRPSLSTPSTPAGTPESTASMKARRSSLSALASMRRVCRARSSGVHLARRVEELAFCPSDRPDADEYVPGAEKPAQGFAVDGVLEVARLGFRDQLSVRAVRQMQDGPLPVHDRGRVEPQRFRPRTEIAFELIGVGTQQQRAVRNVAGRQFHVAQKPPALRFPVKLAGLVRLVDERSDVAHEARVDGVFDGG